MFPKSSPNRFDEAVEGLEEPFLKNDEKDNNVATKGSNAGSRHTCRWRRFHETAVVLHLALIALYTTLYLNSRNLQSSSARIWSPASDSIAWEHRTLDALGGDSLYFNVLGPESDSAWARLLDNMNIRVLPEEMTRLGQTSLELADGSGYLGTMGVYHQLHCLKRVRRWMERDYYLPNMTSEEEETEYAHVNHCLEHVRQSVICSGDTTLNPFEWLHTGSGTRGGVEPTMKMGVQHACVDWERLQEWATSRRVDLFDPTLLVLPESES